MIYIGRCKNQCLQRLFTRKKKDHISKLLSLKTKDALECFLQNLIEIRELKRRHLQADIEQRAKETVILRRGTILYHLSDFTGHHTISEEVSWDWTVSQNGKWNGYVNANSWDSYLRINAVTESSRLLRRCQVRQPNWLMIISARFLLKKPIIIRRRNCSTLTKHLMFEKCMQTL